MIDSGARRRAVERASWIRRHEGDRDGRPGQVTGPRPDLGELPSWPRSRHDDERPALQVLAAPGAAAGLQDAIEVVGLERPVGEVADDPAAAIARQTGSSAGPGSRPGSRHGSTRRRAGIVPDAGDRPPASADAAAASRPGSATLGERPQAAGRPPRSAANGALDVGDALGVRGLGAFGRLVGSSGPPKAARQEPGDGAAVAGVLVQPRVLAALDHAASRPGRASGSPARAARAAAASRSMWLERHDLVGSPWASRTGPRVAGDRRGRADVGDDVAARPEVDPRRQPGQRDRRSRRGSAGGRAGTSGGSAGTDRPGRGRDHGRDARVGGPREDRPDGAHRVAGDGRRRSPRAARGAPGTRPARRRRTRRRSAAAVSAGLAPWPRTSKVRQWKPAAWRKTASGSVRSRADSQPWTRTTPGPGAPSRAGMNQAGSGDAVGLDDHRSRTAGRGRPASCAAGCGADSRRGRDRRARSGRRARAAPAAAAAAIPARRMVPMCRRGRHDGRGCQAGAVRRRRRRRTLGRYGQTRSA